MNLIEMYANGCIYKNIKIGDTATITRIDKSICCYDYRIGDKVVILSIYPCKNKHCKRCYTGRIMFNIMRYCNHTGFGILNLCGCSISIDK